MLFHAYLLYCSLSYRYNNKIIIKTLKSRKTNNILHIKAVYKHKNNTNWVKLLQKLKAAKITLPANDSHPNELQYQNRTYYHPFKTNRCGSHIKCFIWLPFSLISYEKKYLRVYQGFFVEDRS